MAERSAARRSGAKREASSRPRRKPLRGVPGYLPARDGSEFDRLVHERVRLGMLSALAVNRSLSFTELKGLLDTSDGNLSVHARKLEKAGYVACTKTFAKRVPRTEYRLTPQGRKALQRYLDHMEALIRATRKG